MIKLYHPTGSNHIWGYCLFLYSHYSTTLSQNQTKDELNKTKLKKGLYFNTHFSICQHFISFLSTIFLLFFNQKLCYNQTVAITILRKWEVILMRNFLILVVVPFLVNVVSTLFVDWLSHKHATKRDKK